jgi:hypothetical protein
VETQSSYDWDSLVEPPQPLAELGSLMAPPQGHQLRNRSPCLSAPSSHRWSRAQVRLEYDQAMCMYFGGPILNPHSQTPNAP